MGGWRKEGKGEEGRGGKERWKEERDEERELPLLNAVESIVFCCFFPVIKSSQKAR